LLDKHRSRATPHLDRLADALPGWSPNALSWLSFGLFSLGAILLAALRWVGPLDPWFPPVLFVAAAFLVFGGGVFDALDGHVARRRGLSSPRGDLLDHILDRYADVILLLAIAVSTWAQPVLALLALVSLLLVSYMGTQAQAVLGRRLYAGLLGRADRIIIVSGTSLFLAILLFFDRFAPASLAIPYRGTVGGIVLTPLDVMLLFFAVGGQATAVWRASRIWRELAPPGTPRPPR
jgi:archaetidylinositol phosphate synthase